MLMKTKATVISATGQTMKEMWAFLKVRAYRDHEPVMLTGPYLEGGAIVCLFKRMREVDGRRLPNEIETGTLRVTPTTDGVRPTFSQNDFPDSRLFWKTVDEILVDLNIPLDTLSFW